MFWYHFKTVLKISFRVPFLESSNLEEQLRQLVLQNLINLRSNISLVFPSKKTQTTTNNFTGNNINYTNVPSNSREAVFLVLNLDNTTESGHSIPDIEMEFETESNQTKFNR